MDKDKDIIMKQFKDAEERVMKKIKARMFVLSKSKRLKDKMEREIKEKLCPTKTTLKASEKKGKS